MAEELGYFAQEGVFEFGVKDWGPQALQMMLSSTSCNGLSVGVAKGEGRASEAAHRALQSPLIEDVSIESARKVLLNIGGDETMTLKEVDEAASIVYHATNGQADVRMGAARHEGVDGVMKVTMIATGLNEPLPRIEDVADLLTSTDLFPTRRRQPGKSIEVAIDKSDLEVPTFLRRHFD
uniref:Tubulin/FtsZ 2-layer sandwich domain-containing protein n=1 Tax=candidate division WOR-3 bacterium TaxID=2052148 RepID=A0A7C4GHN9_UNCW3